MRIGIDLGGTKIEGAALERGGSLVLRRRVPTPAQDYPATILAVRDLVLGIEQELGQSGSVGIGMPGALSPATGLVKNSNSTCLNGKPFDRDVMAALGREVRFANDANCFALSEASDGAGKGARTVFGVILGTGVGGGIVRDGGVIEGANAIAGEWGHSPLPWPADDERPGPLCYCGRRGCIESFLSGPALAREGGADSAETVAGQAEAGDPGAAAVLARYEDRLARSLATVINLLDPDVIVLGGGLGHMERLYPRVPALWTPYVFSDVVVTRLVPPAWGDSSGVRGAAWLWPDPGEGVSTPVSATARSRRDGP
ncbi:MAG TPA: ROK family protein [Stellaceae bacterium]|nr:ROK family protein [Stellaceae bacterium]